MRQTITVQTEKGQIEGSFCSEGCRDHFEALSERDRQQILLSEAEYYEKYNLVRQSCIFCGDLPE